MMLPPSFRQTGVVVFLLALSLFSCRPETAQEEAQEATTAIKTEFRDTGEGFVLYRGGEGYFIKGARTIGSQHMDRVAAYGGNSVRMGSGGNLQAKLDTAHHYGLSVLFGLPIAAERNGFDYSDPEAVAAQKEKVRQIVMTYKDHPAILMWTIGNELDHVPGQETYNKALWTAINDIAVMIHEIDPMHPAITVIGTGRKHKMADIVAMLPDIDALGINSYGDIWSVPDWLREYNVNRPYLITEWGPTGHWQVPKNKWGLPIEETTTEKAQVYLERHEGVIASDPYCVGGYSFLWTQSRQERTHTWYNMFYDSLEETGAVEVMHYVWTGEWPENRVPVIDTVLLAGMGKNSDILLQAGQTYEATIKASDTDGDYLAIEWELYPENTEFGAYAGQGETRTIPQNNLIKDRYQSTIQFQAPPSADYRLFVYARDGQGNIAIANVPFHTE